MSGKDLTRLREIREQRRRDGDAEATLERYAERLGVSISQLSRIERGFVGRLDLDVWIAISKLYGVELDSLARGAA